jgi:hypothetical protein
MATLFWMMRELEKELNERKAIEVRVGLGYTGVQLDDGSMGLAYTFRHNTRHGCSVVKNAGALRGPAIDLAKMAGSTDAIEAAIGLATMNAAANSRPEAANADNMDVTECLDLRDSDKIAMVGFFAPVADKLAGRDVTVFELDKGDCHCKEPIERQPELLPLMDVAVVTSTSLVNHTADNILYHLRNAREVALLGPSTPLMPSLFKDTTVTLLAGMIVHDAPLAFDIISQGGGAKQLAAAAKKALQRVNS